MPSSSVTVTAKATPQVPILKDVKGKLEEDTEEHKPISLAEITLMKCNQVYGNTTTDKDGNFTINNVPPGIYNLVVTYEGEQTGIIKGYADKTFRPNSPITRAEFASMASSFDKLNLGAPNIFSDVDNSHWAKDYISSAASKGWVNGYTDKTFKPENYITRTEVVTLVNRLLERYGDKNYADTKKNTLRQFIDITSSYWAYYNNNRSVQWT